MNWLDFIGVLGNLATVGAVIVAILTIIEMGKDRKAARQPELVIRNNEVMVLPNFCNNPNSNWINEVDYRKEISDDNYTCFVTIENIGLGVAKDIQVEWKFDFKKMEQKLINTDNGFHISEFGGNKCLDWKLNENDTTRLITSSIFKEEVQNIEFLSPNRDSEYKEKIFLPRAFCSLFSCLVYIEGHVKRNDEDYHNLNIDNTLTCKISYKDIANIKYCKKYEFNFLTINCATNGEMNSDVIECIPGISVNVKQLKI